MLTVDQIRSSGGATRASAVFGYGTEKKRKADDDGDERGNKAART